MRSGLPERERPRAEAGPAATASRIRVLLPLTPEEARRDTPERHHALLCLIRRALRRERARGLAGHWSYDLARHRLLLEAFRAEVADYRSRWGRAGWPDAVAAQVSGRPDDSGERAG
jgi:hypothetical protein